MILIKVEKSEADPVAVNLDIRQGDSLSPILFNLVRERIIREIHFPT